MSSTRQKLIKLLAEQNNDYISGQYLSDVLHISRSAIWKHMNELKKDGYKIEAKAKKGYRILEYPNKLSENTIRWGLNTTWLGHHLIHEHSVSSTQRLAHELALDGAKHGTVVIADEQTSGKGRMDKSWHSASAKGIWMSIILRPGILPYLTPQLTLLTATVLAETFSELADIQIQIKWPNDILVDTKKMTGILTEMKAEQDHVQYVIIGIGINVNQTQPDLPKSLQEKATSLAIETGKTWNIVSLTQSILEAFEATYATYINEGFHSIKSTWEDYGFRMRESLQMKTGNEIWEGIFVGIAEDGALLAQRNNGVIEKVYSGEISWY